MHFNPRAPCGARRQDRISHPRGGGISTHAPLAGRDRMAAGRLLNVADFNPRAPCGARHGRFRRKRGACDISTHAPLAGRDRCIRRDAGGGKISTHAPLAGRDWDLYAEEHADFYFNPRAPCGARQIILCRPSLLKVFQPTRPLRGATILFCVGLAVVTSFQPTRPLRGATHASAARRCPYKGDFNPRAPCGARRSDLILKLATIFQPTRPLRGATMPVWSVLTVVLDFNPRAPCGARPSGSAAKSVTI